MVLACVALAAVYPIIFMLVSSMRTSIDFINAPLEFPREWYLDNYKAFYYRFSFIRLYGNTVVCVAGALLLSLLLSLPAAFAFAKLRFKFQGALYVTMIAFMTIPGITFVLPNYLLLSKWGLVDHYFAVIIIWSVTSIPSTVFLLASLMRGIPGELIEAVRIDGGKYAQLMARVVVPMSFPGVMTVSIFNITGWWNDLMTPLVYLQSDSAKTMTVAVATIISRLTGDYPLFLTGLLLTSLPPILLYMMLQGYIRRGLLIGAIK